MFINSKTIKSLNLIQNSIVRYMTGLAKNSHISDILIFLKLLNINQLNMYMKIIFLKNIKHSVTCLYILNFLIKKPPKKSSLSFFNSAKHIASQLGTNVLELTQKAASYSITFKKNCLEHEESLKYELLMCCLDNHYKYEMRVQLNLILYLGNLNLEDESTLEA